MIHQWRAYLHHCFCVQSKPEQARRSLLPAPGKGQLVASDSIPNLSFCQRFPPPYHQERSAWSLLWTLQQARAKEEEEKIAISLEASFETGKRVVPLVPTVLCETPVSAMNKVIWKMTGRLTPLNCWDGMRSSLAKCITSAEEILLQTKTLAGHTVYVFCPSCSKPLFPLGLWHRCSGVFLQ